MDDETTKMVLGTTMKASLNESQLSQSSLLRGRTICLNVDRLYGRPDPRALCLYNILVLGTLFVHCLLRFILTFYIS